MTRESVHDALEQFCETAGNYTRYRTLIAAILNKAKDHGWLRETPKLFKREDKKKKKREWITREQWDKLYQELPAHLRGPAKFSIETGLRQANVLQLHWSEVSIDVKDVELPCLTTT